MIHQSMNPAAGERADGVRKASFARRPSEHTTGRKADKPSLTVQLLPDGEHITVTGRLAQTLALLLTTGAQGFTSGEASPLGWARRTSAYVHKLRCLGLPILTAREVTPDGAVVARYTLAGPVAVVAEGGDQ
jgi:hypothetical protein